MDRRNIKFYCAAICTLVSAVSCSNTTQPSKPTQQHLSDYVSTLVGTQSEHSFSTGNTYPAVALPWGMNFWTPQTAPMGNGWTYGYNDKTIRGFKQTHQPSPWINDYGQFSLMPVRGRSKADESARASWFSHKSETARPYYYSVYLADHDITAEITPTERACIMRFTFPDCDSSAVVVDAFDRGSYIKVIPEQQTVVGYTTRNSGGVPDNFRNWFVIRFDAPFETVTVLDGNKAVGATELEGNHAKAVIGFKTSRGTQVNARVASSFISPEQAIVNLGEVGDNSFDAVKQSAQQRWDEVLGRIEVSGGTEAQYSTFYSCLYRSVLFPRKFYEIDSTGKTLHYSPYNGQICDGYMYTDTGFWDTFRSLFPLLNLVYPEVNAEIQQGLANTARESGFLPEWASPGHRGCMVGNNSASVVADAVIKGVNATDLELLYQTMVTATDSVHPTVSSTGRLGHQYYNTLGYIPYNVDIKENAARTLEYAYDDWCILQMARKLNRPQTELDKWAKRSQNYRNLFDPSTLLMRGRNADGTFQSPFNPYKWGDAFTEGNSWHYTWSVFHDVQGLVDLMGGEKKFVSMLDSVFVVPPIYDDSYYGQRIHEITEMQVANMGNYAHGNQPVQHMIYLYNYAREPWKAQYWVREVMNRLYSATPDGYCGDEDNGQTSAWYVFSALGFYPVCPASDQYVVGTPLFQKAVIRPSDKCEIVLTAKDNSPQQRYIKSVKVDGKTYDCNYLNHSQLAKGAKVEFTMSPEPVTSRGTADSARPYSFSLE